jgi:hypothetical protein
LNKRYEWIRTVIFSIESPILSSKSMKDHLTYAIGAAGPWFTTTTGAGSIATTTATDANTTATDANTTATDANTTAATDANTTATDANTTAATDANKTLNSSASF